MSGVELQMTDLCVKYETHEEAIKSTQENPSQAEEGKCQKMKKPRRILHFSDGTLEEYSTDEEDETDKPQDSYALLDPKSLSWGPWMYYWMLYTGSSALAVCDYLGEGLANLLGITSPKYQYEIEEYIRCEEEAKAQKEQEDAENAGWTSTAVAPTTDGVQQKLVASSAIQQPPSPSHSQNKIFSKSENSLDIQVQENNSHLSSKADNSSRWDRF